MEKPKLISKKIAFWLLIIFIISGAYLRTANLGKDSLWEDEFLHVFAAKGIVESSKPILPSGELYTRSIIYTYIVAFFFKLLGVSETAARLPSVLFGTLMIPLIYYIASRLLNRNIGLISSFLIAFSPFCISWSKTCRMYSLFQPLYLLCAFYFYKTFEGASEGTRADSPLSKFSYFLFFAMAFILSFFIHDLSVLFIPTVAAYCATTCFALLLKNNVRFILHSKYARCLAVIATFIAIGVICNKYFLKKDYMTFLKDVPPWSFEDAHNIRYYHWFLQNNYPVLAYFFPYLLFLMLLAKKRKGLYLAYCFVVPFLALSFLFVWKGERYMYFIFPFFIIINVYFIENLILLSSEYIRTALHPLFSTMTGKTKTSSVSFIRLVSLLLLTYPLLSPWIKKSFSQQIHLTSKENRAYGDFIAHIAPKDTIICTRPFHIEFYSARRPDFFIKNYNSIEEINERPLLPKERRAERDKESGVLLINDVAQLKALEHTKNTLWIVTYAYSFESLALNEDIRNYVKETYKEHPFSGKVFKIYYK